MAQGIHIRFSMSMIDDFVSIRFQGHSLSPSQVWHTKKMKGIPAIKGLDKLERAIRHAISNVQRGRTHQEIEESPGPRLGSASSTQRKGKERGRGRGIGRGGMQAWDVVRVAWRRVADGSRWTNGGWRV